MDTAEIGRRVGWTGIVASVAPAIRDGSDEQWTVLSLFWRWCESMDPEAFRDGVEPVIDPLVDGARAVGLTPDQVTVLALVIAVVAAAFLALGTATGYIVGGLAVAFTGVLDLVDGRLARTTDRATARGDLLDHAGDRFADAVIVLGVAAGIGRWPLGLLGLSGVLFAAYLGTQAQAVGVGRIYEGLLARAGIIGLVAAASPFAAADIAVAGVGPYAAVLALFGVLGHATAVQRFLVAWRRLDAR